MSHTVDDTITHPVSKNAWVDTGKALFAGAAGGVTQVLLGQPFDLVKVRLQTQGGGNALRTTRNIFTHEGPLAFYKGTLVPLLGIGACVSIQFGAFQAAKEQIERYNHAYRKNADRQLTITQNYLAGGVAGITNSFIAGPVEHVRIRLQLQPHGQQKLYSGPWECIKAIRHQAGWIGLFRGQVPTYFREFHGFGVWFACYEALVALNMKWANQKREDLASWKIALSGGIAGDALWLASYPFDVVKTKMQSDKFGPSKEYRNMRSAFVKTWQTSGIRGFYYGLVPTLVRTMITSGGTFVTVEQVRNFLG